MAVTKPVMVLQQELEELRRDLAALMAEWADTDCFAAQRLGVLECRRRLLLARIAMRERAIADQQTAAAAAGRVSAHDTARAYPKAS